MRLHALKSQACALRPGPSWRPKSLTSKSSTRDGAWLAFNKPELADDAAQRVALDFNKEREDVLRNFMKACAKS
jgi:hypothetical protein